MKQDVEDFTNVARRVFGYTKHVASDEDIERLARNMLFLEERGLHELNKRLIDNRDGVWSTIAEHNFAVILASELDSTIRIRYEPGELRKPPDFKVEMGGIAYWIQMKDLSKLARENKQEKTVQRIKKAAERIKVGKFFSCTLSDGFDEGHCLPDLLRFLNDKAVSAPDGQSCIFVAENGEQAKLTFWIPTNTELSHLTLGCAGDLEVVNITGLSRDQIRGSLRKAIEAFEWDVDNRNINLVVMEADNQKDRDICEAVFGAECYVLFGHEVFLRRNNDGLFHDSYFSKKVAGVIAIRRKDEWNREISLLSPEEVVGRLTAKEKEFCSGMTPEGIKQALEWTSPGPIAEYSRTLYVNSRFEPLVEDIRRLLRYEKTIYYFTKPD